MNKLYLLPVSLILLNPCFAEEAARALDGKIVQGNQSIVSQNGDDDELMDSSEQGFVVTSEEQNAKAYNQARPKQEMADQSMTDQHVEKKQAPVRQHASQGANAQAQPRQPSAQQHQGKSASRPQQAPQAQRKPAQQQNKAPTYDRNGAYAPPAAQSSGQVAQTKSKNQSDQMYSPEDQTNSQGQNGMMDQNDQMGKRKRMVNTPVRPMVKNGYDVWIMGEALLWQAVEENLTYVYSSDDDDSVLNNRTLHTVDFDWDWGFRIGAGYNMPRDGWDLDLYWTHIRNTADSRKHVDGDDSLFQVWTTSGNVITGTGVEAKAHWQVNLEQVDLDLGRQFYVGRCLSIRPYLGMRSAWLYQKYNINFESDTPAKQETRLTNRFWGFGFAAGLDSDWMLGYGICLYGEADMSILLGFFDIDQKGSLSDSRIWSQDKSFRAGRAIMDLGMGLKWKHRFCNDSFGLTLKAGYEYHLYFDQNQFILTNGSTVLELFNPVNGDLIYQGVTGSVQFDF